MNGSGLEDRESGEMEQIPCSSPAEAAALLGKAGIVGQEGARRVAALTLFDCLRNAPTVDLFCGPTGCGKTEIWRKMQQLFPMVPICIVDASTITAEGWKGGTKISSILRSLPGAG